MARRVSGETLRERLTAVETQLEIQVPALMKQIEEALKIASSATRSALSAATDLEQIKRDQQLQRKYMKALVMFVASYVLHALSGSGAQLVGAVVKSLLKFI